MTAMMAAALLMTGCAAFQNMSKTGQGATIGGGGGAVGGERCLEGGGRQRHIVRPDKSLIFSMGKVDKI